MAELAAIFAVGFLAGVFLTLAYIGGGPIRLEDEPTEHGGRPL
jgi:hypothetical protein